ncbi:hypothetical protein HYH03_004716 [Edaphochlamys debaryana]|uniref:Jacalin-type lectin domain-containing protein n=1 Tax=Edaphochlamys debaryana TaxID=47281 RepID=A0A836C1T8_9CHLO|nr:hypothetical protein HYH03_004716 [Edaphochlamys debaryana]|eukprot:KAG2497125.1 hypothetical protein HYH03_004716 [Edaphochlamys debaryana]
MSGAAPITAITVASISWIQSLKMTYGSTVTPRRGGRGGTVQTWTIGAGEYITSVFVRSGWFVDGLKLTTSWGRQTVLGVNGTNWAVATPCLGFQARLIYVSGIGNDFLEQITFYWAALPASPPPLPPAPPPRPPRPPGPAATVPTELLMGPFGGGGDRFTPFVDAPPSAGAQLTGIRVFTGSWVNAIQVAYDGVWGPRRGGSGGTKQERILASGEVITRAVVRAGGYVDGINFITSNNRTLKTGGGGGSPNQAVPCPVGAYKLVGVRGLAGDAEEPYLIQITLVWELLPSRADSALAAEAEARRAGWKCIYGLDSVIRIGPTTSQPECLTLAGSNTCLTGDCRRMLGCAAVGSGPALQLPGQRLPGQVFGRVGCVGSANPNTSKDYQDSTQTCPRAHGLLAMNLPRTVNILMITIILDVCDTGPSNPVSDIELSLYDDPYSLQAYWSTISGGQAVFNRNTSLIKNVKLPCRRFSRSVCDFWSWVSYVDANAAALGVPELSSYPWHRTFVVPKLTNCSDIGFSWGNTVYVRGDIASSAISPNDYLNVFKHEVGHNLGLSHSGRGDNAYGDGSDPMGYCQRCLYNAPHMLQLGWSTPYATLSGTQLPPGVPSDPITIAALTARRHTPVVINPDWLPNSADPTYLGSAIVISYRMRVGQDIGLPDEFDGAVSVHRATVPVGGTTYVEAVVAKGGRVVVAGARLVVSVAPPTQATLSVAVVRVCRYAVSETECVMA